MTTATKTISRILACLPLIALLVLSGCASKPSDNDSAEIGKAEVSPGTAANTPVPEKEILIQTAQKTQAEKTEIIAETDSPETPAISDTENGKDSAAENADSAEPEQTALSAEAEPVETQKSGSLETRAVNLSTLLSTVRKTDESVLKDARTGSPDSIRRAVEALSKQEGNYTQEEIDILVSMTAFMNYAWKTETVSWSVPQSEETDYTAIVDSVRRGLYDTNGGSGDFFRQVLPSLILCSSSPQTNYYDDAMFMLNLAVKDNPDSVIANYLLGLLYRRTGDVDNSFLYIKKAYEGSATTFEIQYEYCRLLMEKKQFLEAYNLALQLLRKKNTADILKLCAESAFNAGNMDTAEQYVAQILLAEPENIAYIMMRAQILFSRGEYLKASSLLDVYAKTDRTGLDYLLLRARVQIQWNKNNNAAAATMQTALSLYPENTDVLLLAAELAVETDTRIGGFDAATLIERVLEKDSSNLKALQLKVNRAVQNSNWEEAFASSQIISERIEKEDSEYMSISLTHATICLNLGMISEADTIINELYGSYPDNEDVQLAYINLLIATGKKAQALSLINSLLQGAQNATAAKKRSILFYQRSRLQPDATEELNDLRSSLIANPRNQDTLFALYRYYFARLDYRKAQYYLKQLIALDSGNSEYLRLNAELDQHL